MLELNYDDLPSLYGFSSTYSNYFELQERLLNELLDRCNDATGVPKRNRAESRKHVR